MKEEIRFPSANGTDTIYATIWHSTEKVPVGVVQIVHGMCEYIDRYDAFARFLAEEGFVVCGDDHLGHGRSAGENGLGYFAPQNGWDYMVEDLHQLAQTMKQRYPQLPYFMLGHSMGSFLARLYMTRYGEELDGALISGTSGPNPAVNAGIMLTKAIIKSKGPFHHSNLLQAMAFGSYNKRCEPKRTPYDWVTRDDAVVDTYANDPWCTYTFTASAFLDLFIMISKISSPDWALGIPKKLPVYLYSGDMDPVGDYGKGVQTVYNRIRNAGVKDTTLKLYEGARHEPHNELNREEVYADVAAWLKEHLV